MLFGLIIYILGKTHLWLQRYYFFLICANIFAKKQEKGA